MPKFDLAAADAFEKTDAFFGETFVLRPYAQPPDKRAAEIPDPTRDVVTLTGIWFHKLTDPREPNAYDPREYRRPGAIGDVPHVEFSQAATSVFESFEIRDGDHIERPSTNTAYRVRSPITVSPSGTLRVPLNRLGPLP